MDTQLSPFLLKSRFLGLGRQILGHLGIFGQTDSTHFATRFSIIQPLFLQKTKSLYATPKYLGVGFEFGLQRI